MAHTKVRAPKFLVHLKQIGNKPEIRRPLDKSDCPDCVHPSPGCFASPDSLINQQRHLKIGRELDRRGLAWSQSINCWPFSFPVNPKPTASPLNEFANFGRSSPNAASRQPQPLE